MKNCDFLILGGGIIGITLAKSLSKKYPSSLIHLLEKEKNLGMHTSTRNSSVLHAGFYYSTDSFKAKFCSQGNKELTQYCIDNKLPLLNTGKIVKPQSIEDCKRLKEIYEQGVKNGVDLEIIDSHRAKLIEPQLNIPKDHQNFEFLWSPNTKVGDNVKVMDSLTNDLKQLNNVSIFLNTKFEKIKERKKDSTIIQTNNGNFESSKIINCAGLYADKIAKEFGFCSKYTILPFKGLYFIDNSYASSSKKLKSLVYPLPPVKGNHFMGVHATLTCGNQLKFGPTATPVFSKENYQGFENLNISEIKEILTEYIKNVFSDKFYFYLIHLLNEMPKHYLPKLVYEASKLVDIYSDQHLNWIGYPKVKSMSFGKPGIRAQLINKETRELVTDFIVEDDPRSLHLLNVVSPGWTCSIPLTRYIVEKYL